MKRIAFFVTPHGFGHAARACAVINELKQRRSSLRFHIFTTVPRWFFEESLADCFEYHPCHCDVGLVQNSPLVEDVEATVEALDRAPWRDPEAVEVLTRRLANLRCDLVIADISVFGLRIARSAGLPSVLVENFTWDWIYDHLETSAELGRFGVELAADFLAVDLHIQALPLCKKVPGAVQVGPVARTPRTARIEVRRRLGIPEGQPMVLATMGGVGWDYGSLERLARGSDPWIVVPGGAANERRRGRLLLLPSHSSYYHPDLVHAADVVVGKLGYSTVAEIFHAGVAFAYVKRPRFPESPVLARFVERNLTAQALDQTDFENGNWSPVIQDLLDAERRVPVSANGSDAAAAAILDRFSEGF